MQALLEGLTRSVALLRLTQRRRRIFPSILLRWGFTSDVALGASPVQAVWRSRLFAGVSCALCSCAGDSFPCRFRLRSGVGRAARSFPDVQHIKYKKRHGRRHTRLRRGRAHWPSSAPGSGLVFARRSYPGFRASGRRARRAPNRTKVQFERCGSSLYSHGKRHLRVESSRPISRRRKASTAPRDHGDAKQPTPLPTVAPRSARSARVLVDARAVRAEGANAKAARSTRPRLGLGRARIDGVSSSRATSELEPEHVRPRTEVVRSPPELRPRGARDPSVEGSNARQTQSQAEAAALRASATPARARLLAVTLPRSLPKPDPDRADLASRSCCSRAPRPWGCFPDALRPRGRNDSTLDLAVDRGGALVSGHERLL